MLLSKFFSYLTWVIFLLLAIPTTLILLSWNALPGDTLYVVKRGMEDVLLAVASPNKDISANLSVKYSERRFAEATSLLSEKHSVVGLAYFDQQIQTAQAQVAQASNPVTQEQLRSQLKSNLMNYQQQLEETKTQIISNNSNNNTNSQLNQTVQSEPAAVVNSTPGTTVTTAPFVATNVTATVTPETRVVSQEPNTVQTTTTNAVPSDTSMPVKSVSSAEMVDSINHTQEQISMTLKELEKDHPENNNQQNNKKDGHEGNKQN